MVWWSSLRNHQIIPQAQQQLSVGQIKVNMTSGSPRHHRPLSSTPTLQGLMLLSRIFAFRSRKASLSGRTVMFLSELSLLLRWYKCIISGEVPQTLLWRFTLHTSSCHDDGRPNVPVPAQTPECWTWIPRAGRSFLFVSFSCGKTKRELLHLYNQVAKPAHRNQIKLLHG